MDIVFTLTADEELTDAQRAEIRAAKELPLVGDEDCPLLDPQGTPELWEKALEAVAERNSRLTRFGG